MATKEELAYEARMQELRQLAADHGVDLVGATTKQEVVDALVASRKVKKEDLERLTSNGEQATGVTTASEADVASPTGGANVAGTPQSQLAITQMTDPSGSNVPAPNLRQPPAEGTGAWGSTVSPDSLDPALVAPEEAARARVEGRTSDATTRTADARAADTPPDVNALVKSSDAGPDQYPFPTGGDVDVVTVDSGNGEDEFLAPLEVEDAVVLAEHELVPTRLVGRRAFVVDAPRYLIPLDAYDRTWITVRTRDEVNATLSIPLTAVAEIQRGAVSPTVRG